MSERDDEGPAVGAHSFAWTSIRCRAALMLVERTLDRAAALGLTVSVAVIDPRGGLKAFAAMDGAPQIAVDMCRAKAAAALMGLGSGELARMVEGQPAMLASLAAWPGISLMGGGLPLYDGGQLVGAIGVGGASTEEDIALAEWACGALED